MKLATLALALVLPSALLTTACSQKPMVVTLDTKSGEVVTDKPGAMTITGTATLEVSPDCADLTMTLTADGAKPGLAAALVQQRQTALVTALNKLGVETPDVKLSYLTLDPVYEPRPDGYWSDLKVHHYRASVTVTATTKQFAKIGAIMEAGGDAGATSMSSQFRRSDLADLKKKVREMALAAARDKATQTAKALDLELGRITAVAENAGGMWNHAYFPQVANAMERADTGSPVALGGTLQPLTLDVTINYELARSS